ncbi:hypothetical protein A0H81_01023 [Grifola frondosa]|uniref:Uncharacterized protein n=1 Tax=Grifola frondosa TaxID=5627 RepID=A0A1C7MNU5_GRIFR|nr:hypothetical protein A0H81_01023 [Grifola frondosa]
MHTNYLTLKQQDESLQLHATFWKLHPVFNLGYSYVLVHSCGLSVLASEILFEEKHSPCGTCFLQSRRSILDPSIIYLQSARTYTAQANRGHNTAA